MVYSILNWAAPGRALVFMLASGSILALLLEFYGVLTMRAGAIAVTAPGLALLVAAGVYDRLRGRGQLARQVGIGLAAGFVAAIAYDVFRLPFVFAEPWGIDRFVPAMPLFKVFAMFGAMILGDAPNPPYKLTAHLVGWAYHLSNGATFGVMYVAMIGDGGRRHWAWAVVFATVLELGMLLTPYPATFGIALSARFVVVTMAAHVVFGVVMGLAVRRFSCCCKAGEG